MGGSPSSEPPPPESMLKKLEKLENCPRENTESFERQLRSHTYSIRYLE